MTPDIYQDFEIIMNDFAFIPKFSTIAVGVSGGSDSMTLLFCLAKWAKNNERNVIALTVDHKLRKESSIEAKNVALWVKNLGLEHKTLIWKGEKPKKASCESFSNQGYDPETAGDA